MNQMLFFFFGMFFECVENVLAVLCEGCGVMVFDDEDCENEGDMIFLVEIMIVEQMVLIICYGSGIVCLCIIEDCCK